MFKEQLNRIWQDFYYGALKRVPDVDLSVIPSNFNLIPHYDEKNEVYWVESPELPDFEATGKTLKELAKHVGDALMVYFDIPYYFAKNFEDGVINITDPRTGRLHNIKVSRSSVERALA